MSSVVSVRAGEGLAYRGHRIERGGREPMTAAITILSEGYLSRPDAEDRTASTVGFIREDDVLVVVDPGLVPGRDAILRPLAEMAIAPERITDVVLSHHHPDHTLNAALFPNARVHDHWAWYRDDLWIDRPAEGFELSPSIRLIETPGHSPQDISTLVDTDRGLVVFTHLWWTATVPQEDPFAPDPALLHGNRARVLALPGLRTIVPRHGAPFEPGPQAPRQRRFGAAERRRDRGHVVRRGPRAPA